MAENKSSGKKRWPIVVGVVAAVLIVACCGGWVWHNTPSFCGTVCHDSMGNHLANYEGTDESNGAGLAAWHGQHEGTTCLDCHTAELDVQVAELQSQLAGDTDNLGLALPASPESSHSALLQAFSCLPRCIRKAA